MVCLAGLGVLPRYYRQVRNLAYQTADRLRGMGDCVGAEVYLVCAAVPFGHGLLARLRTLASRPCLSWTSSGVRTPMGTPMGTPALCGPARVWPNGHPSLLGSFVVTNKQTNYQRRVATGPNASGAA